MGTAVPNILLSCEPRLSEAQYQQLNDRVLDRQEPKRLSYGPEPRQHIDLFRASDQGQYAPSLIVFHGGGWQSREPRDFAHLAQPLLDDGWHVAVVGLRQIPEVDLAAMVARCRQALGGTESEEMARQAAAMADAWRASGGAADVLPVPGRNHFDLGMELIAPEASSGRCFMPSADRRSPLHRLCGDRV
jgi:acetyl esterase/lipase